MATMDGRFGRLAASDGVDEQVTAFLERNGGERTVESVVLCLSPSG
jgi:hypothetical protein